MCRHYRSGLHYRESGFNVPSWLQQVFPYSIRVGEFECFASEDEELNQTQVDPPSPDESIPSKDNCQPILPFFFLLSCWCFPSPAPGPSPVVLSQRLAEGAEGGSRVVLLWGYHNWFLPAWSSAHWGRWVWPKKLPSLPTLQSFPSSSLLPLAELS